MKFLVIKPRGTDKLGDESKRIVEYDASKLPSYEAFVQQQVGKHVVSRIVGDYVFWIADPNRVVVSDIEEFEVPSNDAMTSNLMLNEKDLAKGNVVVTGNARLNTDLYSGLEDQDIAYILNAFTLSGVLLVADANNVQVAVDQLTDSILSPNGLLLGNTVDIVPDIPIIDDSIPEYLNDEIVE